MSQPYDPNRPTDEGFDLFDPADGSSRSWDEPRWGATPPAPTAPTGSTGPPTSPAGYSAVPPTSPPPPSAAFGPDGDPEYTVDYPSFSPEQAPDPFTVPPGAAVPAEPERRSRKGPWLVIAALLAVVAIGVGAAFLVFGGDDTDTAADDDRSTAEPSDSGPSGSDPSATDPNATDPSGSASASGSADPSAAGGEPVDAGQIVGTWEVTGVIESIEGAVGPTLGEPRQPGDASWPSPQQWQITGTCTSTEDCDLQLTIAEADPLTLTLIDGTWVAEGVRQAQCLTGGAMTTSTMKIEIQQSDQSSLSGIRTVSTDGACGSAYKSVDTLTLVKQG